MFSLALMKPSLVLRQNAAERRQAGRRYWPAVLWELLKYPIRLASLFEQDPLQDLKQNPATGLRLERTCSATVRST